MHFEYCPRCGTKCTARNMGDDGAVPFCPSCEIPLFDMFSTCVLSVAVNPAGELALIRQSYGDSTRFVGVAGYMKPGESAEEAAAREIAEEIGIKNVQTEFLFSRWYEKRGQLMLCFAAHTDKPEFVCSGEVAEAKWFSPADAAAAVRPGSIIEALVQEICSRMENP